MTTLSEWLLEQIAEDERLANACLADEVCPWRDEDWAEIGSPSIGHVQMHDPHRVLAECEAKRRIIEEHNEPYIRECGACEDGVPCWLLCLLALPYADRPGYREEWRP